MKKIFILIVALTMLLTLFGCGTGEKQPVPQDNSFTADGNDSAAADVNDVPKTEELSPYGIMIDGVRYRLGENKIQTVSHIKIKGYISEVLPLSDIESLENDGSSNFGVEGLPYGVYDINKLVDYDDADKLVVYAPSPYAKGNWAELLEYEPSENVAPKQTEFSDEVVYRGVFVGGVNTTIPSDDELDYDRAPGDDDCLPPVSLMLDGKIYQQDATRRVITIEDVEVLGYIEEILPKEDREKLERNGQATSGVVGAPYGIYNDKLYIYSPSPHHTGNWEILCEHICSESWGFPKE